MPYTLNPPTNACNPRQALPQHLEHKPFYALPYEHFDGISSGNTDMRYISIGQAQYDPDEVSIKTMRHIGNKWSRQSEELPLHRVPDMTLFLAKTLFDSTNGQVVVQRGTFQNQSSDISITKEQRTYGEQAAYNAFLTKNGQALKLRLNTLRDVLNVLKKQGKI